MLFWPILAHFCCPVVTLVTGCMSVPNLGTDGHVCPSVPIFGTDGQISKNHFLDATLYVAFSRYRILSN